MSSDKCKKILILGGTKEAVELARKLVKDRHEVTTSLAGRTREPEPVEGKLRIGGFGGVNGLAEYLTNEKIELLIDATHPFAKQISKNAVEAADKTKTPLEIHTRQPWQKQTGDQWIEVNSLNQAMQEIPAGARVLLALGSQHIDIFANREDVFYLVRMIDEPIEPLKLPNHQLLIGKPELDPIAENEILTKHQISHIICRNSGGSGAYAKIEAARELQLPVIMIGR